MADNLAYQEEIRDELIDGKLVMMSPRPSFNHNIVSGNIYFIFNAYLKGKKCVPMADGMDLYLTDRDRFVPDGMIVCDPSKIKDDGVHGAPDFIVEVLSPSTAKNDRGYKMQAYEKHGVREYWIVDPLNKGIEIYLLQNNRFVLDNVYSIFPDYIWGKMTEEEQTSVPSDFKCSLFDDLIISLADVFDRTF